MDKANLIAQKICTTKSSDIIYNVGIPANVKTNLTLAKIRQGIAMDFFEDESFMIAIDLGNKKDQYCAVIFTVTEYKEIFCKTVIGFRKNESKQNFEARVKQVRENL